MATGTYVYCVIASPKGNEALSFSAAIDDSIPVRTLSDDGLTAVVSDALKKEYDASRANIGAHERVVREAAELADVLPMRFGSVADDDDMVQRFLRDEHDELEGSLRELHGRAELSLKVAWDKDVILREILQEDEALRAMRDAIADNPETATQDQRIELGRLSSEAIERKRQLEAERIIDRLRPNAVESDVHRLLTDTMVLNAAFLIDRNKLSAFDDAVGALGSEERGRLTLRYIGPMPPYSFVRLTIPKSQEG